MANKIDITDYLDDGDKWEAIVAWLTTNVSPCNERILAMPDLIGGDGWRVIMEHHDFAEGSKVFLVIDDDNLAVQFKLTQ